MGNFDTKMESLRAIPGLSDARPDRLTRLLPLVDEVVFMPGRALVREGGYGAEVFVVIDGDADVVVGGERCATLERGDYVGEIAVLDHGSRTASVFARSQVRALAMDPRGFAALLREPLVAEKLARQLAHRFRDEQRALARTT